MIIEGVDYAFGAPIPVPSLIAAGKKFVGRYAVNDKSPAGRGITASEYAGLVAGDIDVFLYWQSTTSWMLGGYAAGVVAAVNAQANISAAGMPADMPVYFAHDTEPQSQHFAAVDDCLRGAASVIGLDRVGLYGGWAIINHCHNAGTAKWLCQTIAWEYGMGLHPACHLYQYDTSGNYIAGVDVDLVRAYQANFGQANPIEEPAIPTVPWGRNAVGPQIINGAPALAFYGLTTADRDVPIRETASPSGKIMLTLMKGETAIVRGSMRNKSGPYVFIDLGAKGIGRAAWSAFKERWPKPAMPT